MQELESLTTRALLDREALASERRRALAVLTAAGADTCGDSEQMVAMYDGGGRGGGGGGVTEQAYTACSQVSVCYEYNGFLMKLQIMSKLW